jgi:hypothetical protein
MNTVRWNIAVSSDMDQAVRMCIAAQGGGRQAKIAAAGLGETALTDLIDDAVQWARRPPAR